ncbi:energy-coupling factor ABC transporter ATP-binding protein [Acidobacteriota bacterium]
MERVNGIINIQNLNFSYSSEKPVLKNIDLDIKKGEIFGIIGPTGAGKSTLLLHLNGILKGKGEIQVDNIPVSEKTENEVREKVGVVFQNPDNQLFCPTVFEDIAFGLFNSGLKKEEVYTRVDKILEKLNLTELKNLSSHHLSFGEKKRVSLASILVMEPEILCFDEPFANLDYNSIYTIIREIRRLDITRIIISQDILLALSLCDRVAVMHRGEIIRVESAKDIAKDRPVLTKIGIDYQPYLNIIKDIANI